jgi:hypothetical protein
MLSFPSQELNDVVTILELGAQDPKMEICRAYLTALNALIGMVDTRASIQFKGAFFNAFFDRVLQTAFAVMADTIHKWAFREQVVLIRRMLSIVTDLNRVERLAEMLFVNFQTHDLGFYLQLAGKMMENVGNEAEFRLGMKDFLIVVKEYSNADGDLNQEEIIARNQEIEEINRKVPGLMGPPEMTDEDFLA